MFSLSSAIAVVLCCVVARSQAGCHGGLDTLSLISYINFTTTGETHGSLYFSSPLRNATMGSMGFNEVYLL